MNPTGYWRSTMSVRMAFEVHHALATCEDCGWSSEDCKSAEADAAMHAEAKKHFVTIDIGLSGYYSGREQVKRPKEERANEDSGH